MRNLTTALKQALDNALSEAQEAGDGWILSEHLLLGMLLSAESTVASVVKNSGESLEELIATIRASLHDLGLGKSKSCKLGIRAGRTLRSLDEVASKLGDRYLSTRHLGIVLISGLMRTAKLLPNAAQNALLNMPGIDDAESLEVADQSLEDWILALEGPADKTANALWKRMTLPSRRIVAEGYDVARFTGARAVQPEHLLRAFAADPAGAELLKTFGAKPELLVNRLSPHSTAGPQDRFSAQPKWSPSMKRALDLAYSEARNVCSKRVHPEHLLGGLLRSCFQRTADLLASHGLTEARLQQISLGLASQRQAASGPEQSNERGLAVREEQSFQRNLVRIERRQELQRLAGMRQRRQPVDHLCSLLLNETDGPVCKMLERLNCSPAGILLMIEEALRSPRSQAIQASETTVTRIHEIAAEEATMMGGPLDPRHLLLAVLIDGASMTAHVLRNVGLTTELMRDAM